MDDSWVKDVRDDSPPLAMDNLALDGPRQRRWCQGQTEKSDSGQTLLLTTYTCCDRTIPSFARKKSTVLVPSEI